MLCLALVEECGLVFFELACGLADSWHVVTALCGASGGSRTHDFEEDTVSYDGHSKNHGAMAGLVSVPGICAVLYALPLSYRSWI